METSGNESDFHAPQRPCYVLLFFDALKVLHKHHSTVVCFVYPGLKKFTTLHQAGCFRGAFYWVFRKVAVLGWSFIRAID